MVFRRHNYAFPRSRGRISFDLKADGTYVECSPGPVDLPEESHGAWALEGALLVLGAAGGRSGYAWEIVSVKPDLLVVKSCGMR